MIARLRDRLARRLHHGPRITLVCPTCHRHRQCRAVEVDTDDWFVVAGFDLPVQCLHCGTKFVSRAGAR